MAKGTLSVAVVRRNGPTLAYFVELPIYRPYDLTAANLEYSYLGAEH
jgi:hypothetical protein